MMAEKDFTWKSDNHSPVLLRLENAKKILKTLDLKLISIIISQLTNDNSDATYPQSL